MLTLTPAYGAGVGKIPSIKDLVVLFPTGILSPQQTIGSRFIAKLGRITLISCKLPLPLAD